MLLFWKATQYKNKYSKRCSSTATIPTLSSGGSPLCVLPRREIVGNIQPYFKVELCRSPYLRSPHFFAERSIETPQIVPQNVRIFLRKKVRINCGDYVWNGVLRQISAHLRNYCWWNVRTCCREFLRIGADDLSAQSGVLRHISADMRNFYEWNIRTGADNLSALVRTIIHSLRSIETNLRKNADEISAYVRRIHPHMCGALSAPCGVLRQISANMWTKYPQKCGTLSASCRLNIRIDTDNPSWKNYRDY